MTMFKWVAPVYDLAMNVVGHGSSLEKLAGIIEPGGGENLLDLGGGTGQLLDYLPADVKVTLVDSSEAMLARAEKKQREQKVQYIQARGDDMPLEDESFDYAVIADALHHFQGIGETIDELARVIKPEGELYIMEFDPDSPLTKFISGAESLAGEPANFFRPQELSGLLAERGFVVEKKRISSSLYVLKGIRKVSGLAASG